MVGEVQPGSANAPYLKIGDLFAQGCLGLTTLILLIRRYRNKQQ